MDLPNLGIKPGSPALQEMDGDLESSCLSSNLQEDSLPTELSGKPSVHLWLRLNPGVWPSLHMTPMCSRSQKMVFQQRVADKQWAALILEECQKTQAGKWQLLLQQKCYWGITDNHKLYIFKMYNLMTRYTLSNIHHNQASQHSHHFTS